MSMMATHLMATHLMATEWVSIDGLGDRQSLVGSNEPAGNSDLSTALDLQCAFHTHSTRARPRVQSLPSSRQLPSIPNPTIVTILSLTHGRRRAGCSPNRSTKCGEIVSSTGPCARAHTRDSDRPTNRR
jgi:hypothetical protein